MSTVARLLHIEDDPAFAELTADVLETRFDGFEVVTACDPAEATTRLDEGQFDCIVSDYEMPGRNGIDLLESIREAYPNLPFILFTGRGSESVASEAMSKGATDYLQKGGGTEQYELLANRVRNAVEQYRAERELETTRTRFRALTENTETVVLTMDDTSTIRYVNDAVKHVLGYDPEEITGEPLLAIIPDRFHEAHRVGIARYLESGTKELDWSWIEFPGVHSDGHEVPLGVSFGEATVDDGHRFTAVLRDVTEREEYKRSLERTRRQFEALLDSPDSLFGILDPDGTLRRASRTAVELVGARREDLEGRPFWNTPWWEHSEELQRRLRGWVGQAADGEHVRFEATHPTADGDDIPVDGVLRPVTDADGDVVSIVAEGRDISELKERERELAAQRSRFEQLNRINETLRAVHRELVGASDRETLETAICESLTETDVYNGAWVGRYDPGTERIRPTTWANIDDNYMQTLHVRADDTPKGCSPGGRAVRTRTVQAVRDVASAEEMLPWRDRLTSLGVDSIAAIPVAYGDTVYGIVVVYANRSDVFGDDERGALVELGQAIGNAFDSIETQNALERQNERLDEFAGIVSHDLRNPLNIAGGRLELARADCDSEHLDDVAAALDRSEALIDDLLTLSREGRSVEDTEPVDLAALATDCWKTVATTDASLVTATDRTIRADRSRLRQLLENLFRNAVEHGGEDVTITVGDGKNGFHVVDDGPGIPTEDRVEVFKSGYSTSPDGTGFGLSIVQEIARAHGWQVRVSDATDGGARFDVIGADPVDEG